MRIHRTHRLIAACLSVVVLAACGSEGESAVTAASVTFLQPTSGATVSGPDVTVQLATQGVEIVPVSDTRDGTGHHHIFINEDPTPIGQQIPMDQPNVRHFGTGVTEFVLEGLEPGEHRLIALVADWEHVPLEPVVTDTIIITVTEPEE